MDELEIENIDFEFITIILNTSKFKLVFDSLIPA